MKSVIRIKDHEDGKLITISSFGRGKTFELIYGLAFILSAIYFAIEMGNSWDKNKGAVIFCFVFMIVFTIAAYRVLNKIAETEKLFINKERLDIITTRLLIFEKRSYVLAEISDFHFDDVETPRAPLEGDTVDYFGFQGDRKVIKDLFADGKASFLYRGRRVRFGKALASWEFNELEVLLYGMSGNDLRYTDEFERRNFPKN